ncbi:alpha/beta hydrolase [Thalassomonas sp. M1454]|uniref:alpha/beta hydrolase n=1 Tax=Thalassomonas sp. M1454 TaxID=2594477 RepID=UPI00117FE2DF|nr:alpha/beta hydrolase [Thalassomonas sp. M1454]TRX55032.1 hypothetical protein FNN08_10550 [Thalassomonas sp. M1454]
MAQLTAMIKKILLTLVGVIIFSIVGVSIWMSIPFAYQQETTTASLQSNNLVTVKQGKFIEFIPAADTSIGLIFYPGGKTSAETFAPLMQEFAKQGVYSAITPMPLKTAFLGINKADDVIAANPRIKHWYIAGHSLGGVAAAEYIKANANKLAGMLLWASYPGSDISAVNLPVLSIYADKDLQSTPAKIAQYKTLLATTTDYVVISNGNHWQFGHYLDELNQQQGLITRDEQQQQVLEQSLLFINNNIQ